VIIAIITDVDLEQLVERYLAQLAQRGRGEHTLRAYRGDLGAFIRQARAEDGRIDPAGLVRYQGSLARAAPASAARRRSAVRGFLRWAAEQGSDLSGAQLELSAAPDRAASAREPEAPDARAVEAALALIPRQADRDQLAFKLLARVGLRPGELLGLTGTAFEASSGHLEVVGWGGRLRRVLVDDPEVKLRLIHWIRRTDPGSGPLLPGRDPGTPLRYQSLAARWVRYTAAAKVQVPLSALRRAHAAQLLAGGVPEWAVRERLGQPRGLLPAPSHGSADEEICRWRERSTDAVVTGSPSTRDRRHGAA
jgi:integrase